jgi:hypothetical protein
MLLHRLKAVIYLAFILLLSVLINSSKIAPESYGFLGWVSALVLLYAFIEPDQFIAR